MLQCSEKISARNQTRHKSNHDQTAGSQPNYMAMKPQPSIDAASLFKSSASTDKMCATSILLAIVLPC